MLKILTVLLCFTTSIYTVPYTSSNGTTGSFSAFQGKKILIVNIATGSDKVSQIGQLQNLYQQYQDSLVVIAFPSNSFGNESKTNTEIRQTCETVFNATYVIAEKGDVTGASMIPVYQWLSSQTANGVMNVVIKGDFQKILIDGNGNLIGVFGPDIDPMDARIRSAITAY